MNNKWILDYNEGIMHTHNTTILMKKITRNGKGIHIVGAHKKHIHIPEVLGKTQH